VVRVPANNNAINTSLIVKPGVG